ncbi:hypothetical protein GCM10010405_54880 [Streptomyces macrosporus]|uniref:Transposase IS4-like domain-containing protein n=1 Tax=Streptomyces macrosporus TaxID=44032 RepID=A0ABN3KMP8_9ACTN
MGLADASPGGAPGFQGGADQLPAGVGQVVGIVPSRLHSVGIRQGLHGGQSADHGYGYDTYRRLLRARGITSKIARKGTAYGSGLGRTRWVVERIFGWLLQFRRLRICYEIRFDLHLGLL